MIDWTQVDKNSADVWLGLAERLIDKAQTLLTSEVPSEDGLRAMQVDLGEFVSEANLDCPVAAIRSIRRTNDQVTGALTSIHLDDLELRSAKFDAAKARMSSAANELRAEAALLRLEPVRNALATATEVVAETKALATEVRSLRKDEIPGKLDELAERVQRIVGLLREGAGG